MFRLTQKAWNNVIIFAMLFMVLLFSLSNKLMLKNTESTRHFLLPEHGVIMRIEFAEVSLKRVGQLWTREGAEQYSVRELQPLVNNWGQVIVEPQPEVSLTSPYIVSLQLAGESSMRVYQLMQFEQGLFINFQGKTFLAANTEMQMLAPR